MTPISTHAGLRRFIRIWRRKTIELSRRKSMSCSSGRGDGDAVRGRVGGSLPGGVGAVGVVAGAGVVPGARSGLRGRLGVAQRATGQGQENVVERGPDDLDRLERDPARLEV